VLGQSRVTLYGIEVRCTTMTVASVVLSRHNAMTTEQHPVSPPIPPLVTAFCPTLCEASTLLAALIAQYFFAFYSATKDRCLCHWRYIELLKGQGPFIQWRDVTSTQFEKSHESRLWLCHINCNGIPPHHHGYDSTATQPAGNRRKLGLAVAPPQLPRLYYKRCKHSESIFDYMLRRIYGLDCLEFSRNTEWM
jgi:hypothetical protein